ncbi:MAG: hypothetical protein Q8R16_01425 [bacterium]|nr:hypothetical protein [bacterium]
MTDDAKDIAERARAVERIYTEFTQRLEALRQKHNEEFKSLLVELEQRKIEDLRKQLKS